MPKSAGSFDPRQELKAESFEIQHKRDTYLKKVALHHHDFYEIYYLVSGDVTYQIEGRLYHVLPGDLLLISPRELHQVSIAEKNEPYERYVLWLPISEAQRLSCTECDLERGLDASQPRYTNLLHPDGELRQVIRWCMETLYQESESKEYGAGMLSESCLRQLMVFIGRLQETQIDYPREELELVHSVVEYLTLHYSEKITLDQLAAQFFVSKFHLCHEFQRYVGTSIHQYLQKKRLQIAKEMLRTGVSASSVSIRVGFGDYAGFYRAFRSEYGISPREFSGIWRKET